MVAAIASTLLFSSRGHELQPVISAVIAILSTALLFLAVLRRREGATPVFQIGGLYGVMVTLYGAYPLVVYLANGGRYSVNQDLRLYLAQPTPVEMARLGWWYAIYLAVFAAMYLLMTSGVATRCRLSDKRPPRGLVAVVLLLFVVIHLVLLGFKLTFAMNPTTYSEGYLVVQQLPRLARQMFSKASMMLPTLQLLLLTLWFTNYHRNRKYIIGFLTVVAYLQLAQGGSRTILFLVFLAAVMLYHHLVRPMTLRLSVIGGSVALFLFLLLGVLRYGVTYDELVSGNQDFDRSSEFEAVMGNAYDLMYLRDAAGEFLGKPALYLGDFAALVPQQLLPFEKTNASLWYLDRYWPEVAAAGGGMAFGVVSEAIVGHGWYELIWRGVLVGFVFGCVHRYLASRRIGYVGLLFYVWMFVWSYQTIRATTFHLVQAVVYTLLAPLIVVWVVHYLVRFRTPLRRALRFSSRGKNPSPVAFDARERNGFSG
jgi:hypothetical protein